MKKADKMKRPDRWEEAIRSKLEGYEAETEPDSWDAIAARLPETRRRILPLYVRRYAAAVIALALISAGGYFYHQRQTPHAVELAGTPHRETAKPDKPERPSIPSDVVPSRPLVADLSTGKTSRPVPAASLAEEAEKPAETAVREQTLPVDPVAGEAPETPSDPPSTEKEKDPARTQTEPAGDGNISTLLAEVSPVFSGKRSQKRWSVGVGGGSYSFGANGGSGGGGGMNLLMSEYSLVYNAEALPGPQLRAEEKKQKLSHNYPLSFGLGVSYALNDRWALQSGLTYTLLRSEGIAVSGYPGEIRQQLHFIGIPLSLNYKIAEWKRFRLYAAGGILTEWNVGGQIRTDYMNGGEKIRTEKEPVRMKEWLWSVNARAGISYPIVRYVSAYAEGGASYYFNNGSSVETIRSDKPFYPSLQAGIRLGF
jgi:opacity protein-like surface antigen